MAGRLGISAKQPARSNPITGPRRHRSERAGRYSGHDRLEFAGDRVTFWARGEYQVGRCRPGGFDTAAACLNFRSTYEKPP
jgi:hypothetical protein